MSAEAIAATAPEPQQQAQIEVANESNDSLKPTGLHSPPDSNSAMKLDGSDDSELSDLDEADASIGAKPPPVALESEADVKQEEDEDIGEVEPDHWSGTVPVFKPDMHKFKDFKKFMEKVDSYGMKSGIIKIIPPEEWKEGLPELHDMVKQVRVKEPIKQDIVGTNGTYRQLNILHQRSYNLPQWRQLCDQSEHQPPARRGERRAQAPKPKAAASSAPKRRGGGRTTRSRPKKDAVKEEVTEQDDRPMTPISPKLSANVVESVESDPGADLDDDEPPVVGRMGGSRQAKPQTQTTSARRKYARREASARIDEEAFRDWDYRMDISDYTPERCEELERIYWKTLTYAPPLYGADLPGTLFSDDTDTWNLSKLPNLLDVLGTKVPGVNTAYLYLGMWKATFAWHLEDVDLYSINYLHFGAPKQWYSISQADARRFEVAMKNIWPTDAKACDQFLRHKAFLISPNHLQQYFNIKVNKCVSYPGEFVVTYPYGYHSGYNLGYNCAEAVNFALDSWLPMGKIAKRCECAQAQDSVWIDVYEIERKLRGEETDYEETEDEEDEEDDDDDMGESTPQSSHAVKIKLPSRKRKRNDNDKGDRKAKKIRLRVRIKAQVEPPCCLCPNNLTGAELLQTDDGRKAHRICALYGPETWIETVDGKEVVVNAANISKARLELKCLFCRSKRGACFQCSQKKCARSYHATCAAAAGVFVEEGEVPIFGEDGTEYKEQAFEFSCRFHRTKRDKKLDGDALEECTKTREAAAALQKGDITQLQYYRGEIFAGVVVENRHDEQTLLMEIIPNGCGAHKVYSNIESPKLTIISDRVEVEWKWLLLPDPADYRLQKASPNAIPMPTSRKAKDEINATKRVTEELPKADNPFVDGFTWAEFNTCECNEAANKAQVKVDFSRENQIWHYLGKTSTEARAQYTDDPKKQVHDSRSNFLDTVPRPAPVVQPKKLYTPAYPHQQTATTNSKMDKPYQYKPKKPVAPSFVHSPYTSSSPYSTHMSQSQISHSPYGSQLPHRTPQYPYSSQPLYRVPQSHGSQPPHLPQSQSPHESQGTYVSQPYTSQQFVPKTFPVSASTFAPQPATEPFPTSMSTFAPQPAPSATANNVQQPLKDTPQFTPKPPVAPQAAPAPKQVPKLNPPTHSRNKSLPFGTDARFKTSSTYASARYDSGSSSPFSYGFMQPPGLGTSPSAQNGELFQAQARARSTSAASAQSMTTPMTSSAIRPSSSTSSQGVVGQPQAVKLPGISKPSTIAKPTPVSVVQKYAFFQVHHNRDSTKYRTPYAHWGGFTNGYEGNIRTHLMKNPDALFGIKRQSTDLSSGLHSIPPYPSGNNAGPGNSRSPPIHTVAHGALGLSSSSPPSRSTSGLYRPQQVSSPPPAVPPGPRTPSGSWDTSQLAAQLHPAIRAQYAALLQKKNTLIQPQGQSQVPAPAHAPRAPQTLRSGPQRPPEQFQTPSTHGNGHPNLQMSTNATAQRTPMTNAYHRPPVGMPTNVQDPMVNGYRRSPKGSSFRVFTSQGIQNNPQQCQAQPRLPKQTYIPPPRPWEQLQKPRQNEYLPPQLPPPTSLLTSTNKGSGPLPPIPGQNVSGPFWQKLPQTMPNSNSLSQQTSHHQYPYQQYPYSQYPYQYPHSQNPYHTWQ